MANAQLPADEQMWRAANLELIAFVADGPPSAIEQNWWADLTGGDCESVRRRNERVDSGNYRGTHLRVSADLIRIRWGVGPVVQVDAAEGFGLPPDIGGYAESREWFGDLMERWIRESCPPISRISFVGKLAHWTEGREESYHVLDRYLPSVDVDPTASEFQYRINRPRQSTTAVDGLWINRLCTWSAVVFQLQMQVSAGGVSPRQVTQDYNGCLLQMDINTFQDYDGNLPHEQVPAIWRELMLLGDEIARAGDVR